MCRREIVVSYNEDKIGFNENTSANVLERISVSIWIVSNGIVAEM